MKTQNRIRKISRALKLVFIVLIAAAPVVHILIWIFINDLPPGMMYSMARSFPVEPVFPLTPSIRLLSCAVSALPVAVFIAAGIIFIKLFTLYGKGVVFEKENVRCYRNLGIIMLIKAATGVVSRSLLSVTLTIQMGEGHRMLTVGFGSDDVSDIIIGILIILVSWIMEEARIIKEEADLTV